MTGPSDLLADISDVQRLRLNPGDVLVVRSRRDLTHEEAHRIRDAVARVIPDHEVLILSPDLSLEVHGP